MPDRVIDAPIWEKRKELSARLYEEWCQLSIYERGKFTDYVFDYCARLEAEKQEAHTEGWNHCLAMVAANAEVLGSDVAGRLICALSKPSAAKQGDAS